MADNAVVIMILTSLPPVEQVGTHKVPRALAHDPPFRFLVEAFEGRSRGAYDRGQTSSTWESRQKFLDLVNRKLPASDIASLVSTIDGAIFLYDSIAGTTEQDFVFLAALLQFLKDYQLVFEGRFEAISQEIQSRIKAKMGEFESFLLQWHRRSGEEAFDRNLEHAVEEVESMQKNRHEAERRRVEVRERSQEVKEEIERTERWQEVSEEERRARRPKLDLNLGTEAQRDWT